MVTWGGVQIKSLSIIFTLAVNRPRLFSPDSSQSIFMRSGRSTKDCHNSYFSEFHIYFHCLSPVFLLFPISDQLTSVYRGSCQDQKVVLGIRAFDQLVKNSWTCSDRVLVVLLLPFRWRFWHREVFSKTGTNPSEIAQTDIQDELNDKKNLAEKMYLSDCFELDWKTIEKFIKISAHVH